MNHHDPELERLVDAATPDTVAPFGDVLARRVRRRTRRRAAVGGFAAVAVVATIAIGPALLGDERGGEPASPSPAPATTSAGTTESPRPTDVPRWDGVGVPPVTLLLSDRMVVLAPWGWCGFESGCVDSKPPDHLDSVGSPDTVEFSFPLTGWRFTATFQDDQTNCDRSITVPVAATGEGTYEVSQAAPAGSWDVTLFGRGRDGDVMVTFNWTTTLASADSEPGHDCRR